MLRDEVKKVIMVITATYPNWRPADMSFTVDAWAAMLSDFTYQQISAALKAFVVSDSTGFAPSVGQLVNMVDKLENAEGELSEMEAWSMVSVALRNSGYHAEEEFEKLPPLVQKAVGAPSQLRIWGTDPDYNESVTASNFMRTYRTVATRETEFRKIPESVRALITGSGDLLKLEN